MQTLKRIPGKEIFLTVTSGSSVVQAWDKCSTDRMVNKATPTAATSDYVQKVRTTRDATGTLSGFLGTEFVPPNEGDEITVFAVTVGADEISQPDIDDATLRGKIVVLKVHEEYQGDPATASIDFEWGFID